MDKSLRKFIKEVSQGDERLIIDSHGFVYINAEAKVTRKLLKLIEQIFDELFQEDLGWTTAIPDNVDSTATHPFAHS